MGGGAPRELGDGIILYRGSDAHVLDGLSSHTRFLDVLWLPCSLAELTKSQVLVINRHREETTSASGRYAAASKAHTAVLAALRAASARQILELGPGKFPVDWNSDGYLAVDIDEAAIADLRQRGLAALSCADFIQRGTQAEYDTVVAIYSLHFEVSDPLIERLRGASAADGVLLANIISDSPTAALDLLARLNRHWPYGTVLKEKRMARREYFLIMSSKDGLTRSRTLRRAVSAAYLSSE